MHSRSPEPGPRVACTYFSGLIFLQFFAVSIWTLESVVCVSAAGSLCHRTSRSREGKTLAASLRPNSQPRDPMAASNGGGGPGPISAEAEAALGEAIRLVFGRWTALQMAVENQWGGRDSRAKADQLGESILFWFCHTKGTYRYSNILGWFSPPWGGIRRRSWYCSV